MTFEQMKIFLEAAHFGSFTHAAERLGLTQSAVRFGCEHAMFSPPM